MFQLKYNGDFLDLGKDQSLEFERENPLFILDDFYKEYSSPIVIRYTEKNVGLLGGLFFDDFTHQKLLLDAEVWDKGSFDCNVMLVIDKANSNRRMPGKGDVNGFLLSGMSRFLHRIKYRYLNSLEFGGGRTFNYTNTNFIDHTHIGYLQHLYKTADNTYDYICAPVRNDIFNGDTSNSSGWMNNWLFEEFGNYPAHTTPTTDKTDPNYYSLNENKYAVVFPRLKYILTQIFKENGYTLDTTSLDGTDWEQLFLLSLYPIYFYNSQYNVTYDPTTDNGVQSKGFAPSITINLSDCISPEVKCADFIIQICKKYGWTIIEGDTDSFRLIPLKKVKSFKRLDITQYCADNTYPDFSIEERIQAFTNTMPNSEQFANGKTPLPEDGKYIETPVENIASLPDLTYINSVNSQIYDNSIIFVHNENKYYHIAIQTSPITEWNNKRAWVPFVDNVYNYQPPNSTNSIDTDVTTLPVYWTQHRRSWALNPFRYAGSDVNDVLFYGFFPVCQQSRFQNWGIRTMQFVGVVYESYMMTASGPLTHAMATGSPNEPYTTTRTEGLFNYPLLSCIRNNGTYTGTYTKGIVPYDDNLVGNTLAWSNVYSHTNPLSGKDDGIIAYWFQDWLDTIGLTNVYEQTIYLPKHILKQLTPDTILMIRGQAYLIQSYTEPIPYKGSILAKMVRLIFDKNDATVTVSSNIYLKLDWENLEATDNYEQPFTYTQPTSAQAGSISLPIPFLYKIQSSQKGNLVVKAYSDPLGKNLIEGLGLRVNLRVKIVDNSGNLIDLAQLTDYLPSNCPPMQAGNYHSKVFLKDGTANIADFELVNDVNILLVDSNMQINWKDFYNFLFAVKDMTVDDDGNYLFVVDESSYLVGNFSTYNMSILHKNVIYKNPRGVQLSSDGKIIRNGILHVPPMLYPALINQGNAAFTPYIRMEAQNIAFIQQIELAYSPNYIIIP